MVSENIALPVIEPEEAQATQMIDVSIQHEDTVQYMEDISEKNIDLDEKQNEVSRGKIRGKSQNATS